VAAALLDDLDAVLVLGVAAAILLAVVASESVRLREFRRGLVAPGP
jgi:hypothetical protein